MNDGARWAIGIFLAFVVIGLIVWARGPAHHRGVDVGVRPPTPVEQVTPTLVPVAP
jgi:hypothetical protein